MHWGGREMKFGFGGSLIGKKSTVTLTDETTQRHTLAVINVDCPFFQGQTEALSMNESLYDLVIGNIDDSRLPDVPFFSGCCYQSLGSAS